MIAPANVILRATISSLPITKPSYSICTRWMEAPSVHAASTYIYLFVFACVVWYRPGMYAHTHTHTQGRSYTYTHTHIQRQCAQWRPVPGAVIYSSCNHVALNVVSKTDKVHRFMSYKFKTSVTNKQTINLVNTGVTIQLDSSTGKVKTLAWPVRKYLKNPVTNGTTITWPVVPLKAGKKQGFGVKVYVKKGTSNKTLVFTVSTFQTFVTPSGSKENICCKYDCQSLAGIHVLVTFFILISSHLSSSLFFSFPPNFHTKITRGDSPRIIMRSERASNLKAPTIYHHLLISGKMPRLARHTSDIIILSIFIFHMYSSHL